MDSALVSFPGAAWGRHNRRLCLRPFAPIPAQPNRSHIVPHARTLDTTCRSSDSFRLLSEVEPHGGAVPGKSPGPRGHILDVL